MASRQTVPPAKPSAKNSDGDDRLLKQSFWQGFLANPEFGAVAGTVLVFVIFLVAAGDSGMFSAEGIVNWGTVAAYLGIIAVAAALLMIGGEFDLSIGSMIGFAGMVFAIPVLYWGLPPWVSAIITLIFAMGIGWLNGYIVVKTGLSSFIVTLALFFVLRGLTLAVAVILTNQTIISSNDGLTLRDAVVADPLFSGLFFGYVGTGLFNFLAAHGWLAARDDGAALAIGIPKVMVWWLVITVVGAFVLLKMRFGNWVQAVGGDANAAKNLGIPVQRVKIILFMLTALAGALFGLLQVADAGSAAADRGMLKEFEAIIAAVIGGCLLTGGYGSVIGASLGALIFGMVQIGIGYTSIDNSWYRVILGVLLLLAVVFNNYVRKKFAIGKV
ncbi:MAG: ABC transporter permease [Candidatus Pacebacteria bacterium]|nr:ABC transporter permease [Candidatus Paceibacterota bacterium]